MALTIRSLGVLGLRNQYMEALEYSKRLRVRTSESWTETQLRNLQDVWMDCVEDVPFYRKLVLSGKAPPTIESWADFRNIPILDRRTLQENCMDFVRLSGPPDSYLSTAGSTGQPVRLGQWSRGMECLRVAKLVPWTRLGYQLSDRLYLIWGHAHLLGTGWRRHINHIFRMSKDRLAGYRRVDAYRLDRDKAKRIASEIVKLRPAGLIGYAAVLDLLCRYSPESHQALRDSGLKFVMPCAEPPPRDDTFQLFRQVFDCPIVQEFGGVDFGHVGFKIDEQPYELFPDLNILEAESALNDATSGAAIVTTLYRRYVPLIRYRQGDQISGIRRNENGLVVAFDEQIGRVNDMVELADGFSVHSVAIVHCFKDEPLVLNVQLALRDDGPTFSLVVERPLPQAVEQRIRVRLSQIHAGLTSAKFEYVMDVETNRAGKRRWFVDLRKR